MLESLGIVEVIIFGIMSKNLVTQWLFSLCNEEIKVSSFYIVTIKLSKISFKI